MKEIPFNQKIINKKRMEKLKNLGIQIMYLQNIYKHKQVLPRIKTKKIWMLQIILLRKKQRQQNNMRRQMKSRQVIKFKGTPLLKFNDSKLSRKTYNRYHKHHLIYTMILEAQRSFKDLFKNQWKGGIILEALGDIK